jgi:hypothetical protein
LLLSPSTRPRLTLCSGWPDEAAALPVAVDHRGEFLGGCEALFPAREEGVGSALGLVTPELAQGLFEQIGGVQLLVGLEQLGEGPAAVEREVLAMGSRV